MSKEDAYQANFDCFGQVKLWGEIQLGMIEGCSSAVAKIFNAYGEYCEYEGTAQPIPGLIKKAIRHP
jgi:hypothetical protein